MVSKAAKRTSAITGSSRGRRVIHTLRGPKAGVAMVTSIALVMAVLASMYRGVPVANLELNDGGVWVTNKSISFVGHLNYPSRTLDQGLLVSENFDVYQHANTVTVNDLAHSGGASVDVANKELRPTGSFPASATMVQGGDTIAVIDPKSGKAWAMAARDISTFSAANKPLVEKSPGIRGTVDGDGVVHLVTSDGKIQNWQLGADATSFTKTDGGHLTNYSANSKLALAAVGSQLVVLDLDAAVLHTPKGSSQLPKGVTLALQDSGPASDTVLVSSPTALLTIPMQGGDPSSRAMNGTGTPVSPVFFKGCAYAAWMGTGTYLRDCPKDGDDVVRTVNKIAISKNMVFRVNRDVIVLNDVDTGLVLLVEHNMDEVDNWQQMRTDQQQQQKNNEQSTTTVNEIAIATTSKTNHPPTAKPDSYGVRAGQANWLPVLANDEDPDGDILTASADQSPKIGSVQPITNGEALQIAVPRDAVGEASFPYTISDGRGGQASSTVRVSVHPFTMNGAPKLLRQPKVSISQGGSTTYNVLPDWFDPDGDQVYLSTASAVAGTQVEYRADGTITVRDLKTADPGTRRIPIRLTDGRDSAEGALIVEVKAAKNVPPVANSDHITVVSGRTAIVQPLANDTDANADTLRLTQVSSQKGLTVIPDLLGNTVSISASTPGTRYLTYKVTDGRAETSGVIRVDVINPDAKGQPPAAVPDLALVSQNNAALLDLTANDSDPMGGVLVVSSLQVDRATGLSVQLLDHHIARVSAPAGVTGSNRFTYTVSNGYGTAQGQVKVLPLAVTSTDQPPVATDDTATVRAGDIASVDVLANDNSPADLPLTIDPKLSVDGAGGGVAFVSDNKVRFRAGGKAGTTRVTYTVRDTAGGFGSATVTFTVIGLDDANDPPKPTPLIARTISGASVRIPIATSGQDPDGDSVTISGLSAPIPHLGAVTVGDGYVQYTPADDSSGTDVFGYTVTDRFGASGTGVVYVGIAAAPSVDQAPFAVADTLSARPSRALSIQVSANDIDPDGDPIHVVADSVKPTDDQTTTPVSLKNDRVELTTPATDGVLRYYYDISDGRGGTGRGVLTINVSKTAPLLYPIARDDVVTQQQVTGQTSVSVPVLDNDEDPDGATSALTLASEDAGVSVSADRKLVIPVTNDRQVIVYSITDPDHQTAKAVVIVPGVAKQPPVLMSTTPAQVKAGELLTLKLADYVKVRSGHSPRLTFAETVKAAAGANGASLVKDYQTLVFTSTKEFSGLTSITFEVTDGSSATDAGGQKATLTIPIQVLPNPKVQNKPPVVRPAQVSVAAGDPAKTVDLDAMASDPDPADQGKLRYTLGNVTAPFRATLSGSVLSVSAPADARAGTPGTATIQVSDGTNPAVTAAVPLVALSSTRPLMAIAPISVTDATAGQPSTVDLTASVTNPFAAEGKPVHLVGSAAVTSGSGTVSASGLTLTITPTANTNGQLMVKFRLGDATNDATREQTGTVAVTVRDKPAAPTNVVAVTNASKTADVTWAAGANNGAPITGFTVNWTGANGSSGHQTVGQVTHLTVTGLTNNVYYTFTVAATNAKGDSAPSTPSNRVRPDTKPDVVGRPTGVAGDRQISVSWPLGTTQGAPIASYSVTISPPAGGVATKDNVRGTNLVWTGLTNGTSYSFTVVAVSVNDLRSDASSASAPVVPVGAPFQPSAPHISKDSASNLTPSGTVSWTPPNGNGDNNMTYEMREKGTSTVLYSGTATQAHVSIPQSSNDQTFEVRATNRSNLWSPWSPESNAVRPFKSPGAIQSLTVSPTGNNNEVRFNFSPGALNGAQANEMSYRWSSSAGGSGTVTPGQIVTSGGFPNGQNVTVTVVPVAQVNGETAQGPTTSTTVNAYGPPTAPAVSAHGNVNDVTLTWDASGSGNGRPLAGVELDTSDGPISAGIQGSRTEGSGRAQEKCIRARAIDSGGTRGDWSARQCGTTWSAADWQFSDSGVAYSGDIHYLKLALFRYEPNSRVYCYIPGVRLPSWEFTFTVDANGNWGPDRPSGSPAQKFSDIGHDTGSCQQK